MGLIDKFASEWQFREVHRIADQAALAMCVVSTETRVWATDDKTVRRFALYWWTIRLGSGLIRRMWLRAIRRRAERIGS